MSVVVASVSIVVALLGFLVLLAARELDRSGELPDTLSRIVARLRPLKLWHFIPIVAIAVVVASPQVALPVLALLILVACALMWVREFLILMGLRDDDFPGRFDKPIWAFVLIALGPVGLWMFVTYRNARWPSAVGPEASYGAKPAPAPDLL